MSKEAAEKQSKAVTAKVSAHEYDFLLAEAERQGSNISAVMRQIIRARDNHKTMHDMFADLRKDLEFIITTTLFELHQVTPQEGAVILDRINARRGMQGGIGR